MESIVNFSLESGDERFCAFCEGNVELVLLCGRRGL
jgi:hypothetical protein